MSEKNIPENIAISEKGNRRRGIKSYILRAGRLTAGQQRALDEFWPLYGIASADSPIALETAFGRTAPVIVEIGFGNGDNLVDMATTAPENNFLGIEVHEPGVGHCLLRIDKAGITNVRLLRNDAVEIMQSRIAYHSLARVNLFFPDPWHKKRHHKRRIVQPDFMRLIARKLQPGGIFHVVTDWADYAENIAAVLGASPEFLELPEAPNDRSTTRFENRGQRLGHSNWERAWCTRSNISANT